jgi:hypothetical protein
VQQAYNQASAVTIIGFFPSREAANTAISMNLYLSDVKSSYIAGLQKGKGELKTIVPVQPGIRKNLLPAQWQ